MPRPMAATLHLALSCLFSTLFCIAGIAQNTPTASQTSSSGRASAYRFTPVTVPFQLPDGTTLRWSNYPGPRTLNDKGEIVFKAVWTHLKKLHEGVCTSKRIVVEWGDIIDGAKIVQIQGFSINNAGQVLYDAYFIPTHGKVLKRYEQMSTGKYEGIFIDRHLKFILPAFTSIGGGESHISDSGTAYYVNQGLVNLEMFTHKRDSAWTSDGVHWFPYNLLPAKIRNEDHNLTTLLTPSHLDKNGNIVGPAGLLLRRIVASDGQQSVSFVTDTGITAGDLWLSNRSGQFFFLRAKSDFRGNDMTMHVETPTPLGYIATPGSQPPAEAPPPCPRYKEMEAEAKELSKLADTLEMNDQAYQEAVIDVLLQGYDSDYARLGLAVDEDEIPTLFADEASIQAARKGVVESVRAKAAAMANIANTGITNDYSEPGRYTSKASVEYFCSRDPAKLSEDAWEGLYQAGYIDYPTYKHIYWKNFVDNAFDTSISAVIQGALWEFTVTKFLVPKVFARFPIKFGGATVSLDLVEVQTLKGIAQKEVNTTIAAPIGKLGSTSVSAESLNTISEAAGRFPEWADNTLVRTITLSKERGFVRVYWKGMRNGEEFSNQEGLWATFKAKDIEGLTAAQIKDKFGLKFAPNSVCDAIAPTGTKLRVGWAREQPQWKAVGGGRQIEIEPLDVKNMKYVNERPLP